MTESASEQETPETIETSRTTEAGTSSVEPDGSFSTGTGTGTVRLYGDSLSEDIPDLLTLVAGYAGVKTIGPFLEAFSKKLGEQLGETTSNALSRLLVRRRGRMITIFMSDAPTTLHFPDDPTDEAKLAAIELDFTAADVRGAVLFWNPDPGAWEKKPPRRP